MTGVSTATAGRSGSACGSSGPWSAAGKPTSTGPGGSCWLASPSANGGSSWPGCRPPCSRAATARRWCCCTARAAGPGSGCRPSPGWPVPTASSPRPARSGRLAGNRGPAGRRDGAGLARRAHRPDLRDPAGAGRGVAGRLHRRPVRGRPPRPPGRAGAHQHGRPGRQGAAPAADAAGPCAPQPPAERTHRPGHAAAGLGRRRAGPGPHGAALGAVPLLLAGAVALARPTADCCASSVCPGSRRRSWPVSPSRPPSSGGGRTG